MYKMTTPLDLSSAIDDPTKVIKVVACDRNGDQKDVSYTNCKIIGNGSFGVVFQARLTGSNSPDDDIAIKKVLQDKRFKVGVTVFRGAV
jgi:glycogen synthase kinase 3 beta